MYLLKRTPSVRKAGWWNRTFPEALICLRTDSLKPFRKIDSDYVLGVQYSWKVNQFFLVESHSFSVIITQDGLPKESSKPLLSINNSNLPNKKNLIEAGRYKNASRTNHKVVGSAFTVSEAAFHSRL